MELVKKFLFHTGSIKSWIPMPSVWCTREFLFHTGSIKRLYESHRYIIRNPYDPRQVNFHIHRF